MAMKDWSWVDWLTFLFVLGAGLGVVLSERDSTMRGHVFIALVIMLSADKIANAIRKRGRL